MRTVKPGKFSKLIPPGASDAEKARVLLNALKAERDNPTPIPGPVTVRRTSIAGAQSAILDAVAEGARSNVEILTAIGVYASSFWPAITALCTQGTLVAHQDRPGARYEYRLRNDHAPISYIPPQGGPEPCDLEAAARHVQTARTGSTPARRAVLAALTHAPTARNVIAARAGVSPEVTANVLAVLVKQGRAVREGTRYRLPIAGGAAGR